MTDNYFEHTDGGLYRFVDYARSADTDRDVVIYEHLWPFDKSLWVRDHQEFEARFKTTSQAVVNDAMQGSRDEAQRNVLAAKAARRSVKASS